jgi:hypothetical protein
MMVTRRGVIKLLRMDMMMILSRVHHPPKK